MKKTIQLTESDIRRMVMEAINELDWKTYQNAAIKSMGGKKQKREFTTKPWGDESGKRHMTVGYSGPQYPTWHNEEEPDKVQKDNDKIERSKRFLYAAIDAFNNKYPSKGNSKGQGIAQPDYDVAEYPTFNTNSQYYNPHDGAKVVDDDVYNKALDDYTNYWNEELDESITRAIRKYLR